MIAATAMLATVLFAGTPDRAACAATPVEAVAQPLPPIRRGKPAAREYDVATASVCLVADGAPRRALVFALGDYAPPLALEIASLPRRGAMLAPAVKVVDRDGREIASHAFAAFRHRGEAYTLTVFLNDAGAAGGRLVVSADPASAGRSSRQLSAEGYYFPLVSAVAMWNFVGTGEARNETAFAEAGTVRLVVAPGEPRTVE